jgi:hypothetical protein
MRLKSHESPRKGGRNHKGRGGAARQRQLKKRSRLLVNKLKRNDQPLAHSCLGVFCWDEGGEIDRF